MATITGLTASRMLQIEAESVVSGLVDLDGRLILYTRGGDQLEAGDVRGTPGLQGLQGPEGQQGIPGADGANGIDGASSYTHIAYADTDTGDGFSQSPTGKAYIGMYVDFTVDDSSDPSKYAWSRILGADGAQGVPGTPGEDGLTPYFHTAWADSVTGIVNFNTTDPGTRSYLGTYTDYLSDDSTDPSKYAWSKILGPAGPAGADGTDGVQGLQGPKGDQGIQGSTGANGLPSYTHIAYADTSSGGGFSQTPTGKAYMGMYVDSTAADSSTPSKYAWSLIKGADGSQGLPGTPGTDGQTPYFHTAWADSADGTNNFSSSDPGTRAYLGTYTDYTPADSSTASKYAWSKILGPTGPTGKGISSTTIAYQASTSGITPPGSTWTTSIPTVAAGQYLWTRTVISYTDSTTSTLYSVGKMGLNGSDGTPGAPGTDGQTSYLHVAYATNSTGTTGFSTTDPSGKTYLGTYTDFVVADSNTPSVYSWSLIKGADGATGSTGPAGKGISSSAVTYQASASGTTAPAGTWSAGVPSVPVGQYLWTRTVITFTDGGNSTIYTVAHQGTNGTNGAKGDTGNTGAQGVSITSTTRYYQLATSAPAKPTTNPPGGSWTTTEPTATAGKFLYTVDLTILSNSTFLYSTVSLSSAYAAAVTAQTKADSAFAKAGVLKQSTEPDSPIAGQLWLETTNDGPTGQVVALNIYDGTDWIPNQLVADSILAPSSIGDILIGNGAITAPKIFGSEEMWTKILGAHLIDSDEIKANAIEVQHLSDGLGSKIDLTENAVTIQATARVDSLTNTVGELSNSLETTQSVFSVESDGAHVRAYIDDQLTLIETVVTHDAFVVKVSGVEHAKLEPDRITVSDAVVNRIIFPTLVQESTAGIGILFKGV